MSMEYDNYLSEHISNVQKGLEFFKEHIPDVLHDDKGFIGYALEEQFANHDKSKYDEEEYEAYDVYFYGKNKTQAVLEMICDWWAFSWKKGDLFEIFKWYEDHKKHIQLGPETRKKVEDILNRLRAKLATERVML